ncbi:glycerate kinase [Luethyella okanaganae]|uniref:Glycerate kinase n=1 Tax=Luethyella okanaganae TaxID=69372 RepID=A0ABW1VHI0_9MICO
MSAGRRSVSGFGRRLRVVIAPDSFKGTATAVEAAAAIASGWWLERPGDEVVEMPMADGGEGTVDAFAVARPDATRVAVEVIGPDDAPVRASWLLLRDPDGRRTGVVELASASGITLLDPLRPWTAHTRGFGQAVVAALDGGVDRLVLGIGGSSSTDGGAGVLRELGAEFFDGHGEPIGDGLRGLAEVASVRLDRILPPPPLGALVLSDVTSPLLGERGAVSVFGFQKGLAVAEHDVAEQALERFATVLAGATGADPATAGSGAAGGVGFGLLAWGAQLSPGSPGVGEAIGLERAIACADLVVTGEGRYDRQSAGGKVPGYVLDLARAADIPVLLVAGVIEADASAFRAAASLAELAGGTAPAMAAPARWLREAGRVLARG